MPDLFARGPRNYPNPFPMKLGGVTFDSKLSAARRNVVNALYDQVITFRHAELNAAWGAIHAGEVVLAKARAAGKAVEPAEGRPRGARTLASAVPIDAKRAADTETNAAFKDRPALKARLETEWDTVAKANYAKAWDLASRPSPG